MNRPALVGRADYLAELDAALARARDGGPSALLIGGEAGIGKTRLHVPGHQRGRAAGLTRPLG